MSYFFFLCFAFIGTFASRYTFREKFPNIVDSVVSSRAIIDFNMQQGEPPAPGYFLYIMLGKMLSPLFSDPFFALTFLSVFFAAASVVILSLLARSLFGKAVGIMSALLYIASGTFWFFGISTLVYIVSFFFHILTVYGIVILIKKHRRAIWLAVGGLAALLATRTHELIHVSLLLFFLSLRLSKRQLFSSFILFILLNLLWIIPLLILSGGLDGYFQASRGALSGIQQPSLLNTRFYLNTIAGGFLGSFSFGLVLFLYPLLRYIVIAICTQCFSPKLSNSSRILILWLIPIVIYQTIFKSDHPSHTLALLGPATILMAKTIALMTIDISLSMKKFTYYQYSKDIILFILVGVITTMSIFAFFRDFNSPNPPYLTASWVAFRNKEGALKQDFIKNNYNPETTWVVVDQRRWVAVSYSLPEFQIVTFEDVSRKGDLFQHSIGLVKNHKRQSIKKTEPFFQFPENVKTVVFFDNHFEDWVDSSAKSTFRLEKCCSVTVLEYGERDKFEMRYHSIRHLASDNI